jgi:hypothetical protein
VRTSLDIGSAYIADSNRQHLFDYVETLTDGVPALSMSSNNFQEWKSRILTYAVSEGLIHLLLDGQDVLIRGIPTKPIKDETTQQMVMPPENELTGCLEHNAVILQNNGLFLIMSRSLMFGLHHLLETEATVLAEERAKAVYYNICRHFKPSTLWLKEGTQHKWDSIVMMTPTESFNNMQALLAECTAEGIVITQENAAIRFVRLLQQLRASYIPLMQFVFNTENMTLGLL